MWKNGAELSGTFDLAPINTWMVVTVEVKDNCASALSNYYIGRSDHSQADIEVAEILAFGGVLSDGARGDIELYLSNKWGVTISG